MPRLTLPCSPGASPFYSWAVDRGSSALDPLKWLLAQLCGCVGVWVCGCVGVGVGVGVWVCGCVCVCGWVGGWVGVGMGGGSLCVCVCVNV